MRKQRDVKSELNWTDTFCFWRTD